MLPRQGEMGENTPLPENVPWNPWEGNNRGRRLVQGRIGKINLSGTFQKYYKGVSRHAPSSLACRAHCCAF